MTGFLHDVLFVAKRCNDIYDGVEPRYGNPSFDDIASGMHSISSHEFLEYLSEDVSLEVPALSIAMQVEAENRGVRNVELGWYCGKMFDWMDTLGPKLSSWAEQYDIPLE